MQSKGEIQKRIAEIEAAMNAADFWDDKFRAQTIIKELQELKAEAEGGDKYDKGNAILSIVAGAGGADAEDFARMLFEMYEHFAEKRGWGLRILHKNENDHGGFRNFSAEITGRNVYSTFKRESGVHRLVRISPFNANQLRQTSFCLVEFVPQLPDAQDLEIPESELDIQYARSSGPGGQNVNKRETAVRIVHKPTNLSVHIDGERTQQANLKKGLEILRGKLYRKREEDIEKERHGFSPSKTTQIEWGSQIRSYVLHPYKLVKDHRTGVEVHDAEGVLSGNIEPFLEGEKE